MMILLLDDTNTLRLKVSASLEDPPRVCDHHVPVFTQLIFQVNRLVQDLVSQEVY